MLRIFDQPPPGLWDRGADDLLDCLGGPALIHIQGELTQPLFVSTLLHGNETTGWQAICALMKEHQGRALPRAMSLFVGNVRAASQGLRHLDDQSDFNRIWNGHQGSEAQMSSALLSTAQSLRPLACIDLHNTSGENPVYGCVHNLEKASCALAQHFSQTVVLVRQPKSLLSMALARFAPAITLECGKPGDNAVTTMIKERLFSLLSQGGADISTSSASQVFQSVARVRVPEHVSFSFTDTTRDLHLRAELEQHNFRTLPSGTVIASIRGESKAALEALDNDESDVSQHYFELRGGQLITTRDIMPSMFTVNERIVRQDCLCYLMEPIQ